MIYDLIIDNRRTSMMNHMSIQDACKLWMMLSEPVITYFRDILLTKDHFEQSICNTCLTQMKHYVSQCVAAHRRNETESDIEILSIRTMTSNQSHTTTHTTRVWNPSVFQNLGPIATARIAEKISDFMLEMLDIKIEITVPKPTGIYEYYLQPKLKNNMGILKLIADRIPPEDLFLANKDTTVDSIEIRVVVTDPPSKV